MIRLTLHLFYKCKSNLLIASGQIVDATAAQPAVSTMPLRSMECARIVLRTLLGINASIVMTISSAIRSLTQQIMTLVLVSSLKLIERDIYTKFEFLQISKTITILGSNYVKFATGIKTIILP